MTTYALILSVSLFTASPAIASGHCALVAELNAVIRQATGYATPPCPIIGFAILPAGGAVRSQAGAYYPGIGTIELAPDLDLTTDYGQSFLLHELVHAAQYSDGVQHTARCPAALEAEAYDLQAEFLRARGIGREAVMMSLLAGQLGACAP